MSKGKAVLLASPESLRERPLGVVHLDSLEPPFEPGVPWLSGLSVTVAFWLGRHGWHWSYLLVVFWLVVYHERRRLSHFWAELRREADSAALLAPSKGKDGVDWLNHTLRALWPVYERGMSGYVLSKLVKIMGDAGKVRIGGLQLGEVRIKDLCFGWPAEGDALPPLYLTGVQAVEKSESRAPDGLRTVRVVLKADARFAPPTRAAGGAKPGALSLQMKLLEPIGVKFEVTHSTARPVSYLGAQRFPHLLCPKRPCHLYRCSSHFEPCLACPAPLPPAGWCDQHPNGRHAPFRTRVCGAVPLARQPQPLLCAGP
jgi:hypothetical protein